MLKIFICVTARLRLLFLLQETLLRVAFLLLGSLSKHNDDDNNNVKRQLILWAKQQLCKCITLCSTFLWRSRRHDYHVKPPNATFYGGHQHTTTNFPIFLEPGLKKIQEKSPIFDKLNGFKETQKGLKGRKFILSATFHRHRRCLSSQL